MQGSMKKMMTLMVATMIFQGCGDDAKEMTYDDSLEGRKQELKDLKKEMSTINSSIQLLEMKIGKEDPSIAENKKRLVTTDVVKKKDFSTFVEIQGAVQPDEIVSASSETGGRLLEMKWEEGDWIDEGALVARTDVETIQKNIDEVNKMLELANDLYVRQKNLWDQKIGSEVSYLQAKNSKEQLEKKLETIRHQLTKGDVFAPISGVVDRVGVKQGEMAGPGVPIISIMRTYHVKVSADVSENYLKSIKRGQAVKVGFPALERELTAKISKIGRTINPQNRTFAVEVKLRNKDGMLKPNLLAIMYLNDFKVKDAVVLPTELVQQDVSGKEFVYIKDMDEQQNEVARKVIIQTSKTYEGESVVEEGLEGGESIIVQGSRDVADGESIKVLKEKEDSK